MLLGQFWFCSISSGCLILNPTKSCEAALGRQHHLPLRAWKSSVETGSIWVQARSEATTFTHRPWGSRWGHAKPKVGKTFGSKESLAWGPALVMPMDLSQGRAAKAGAFPQGPFLSIPPGQ